MSVRKFYFHHIKQNIFITGLKVNLPYGLLKWITGIIEYILEPVNSFTRHYKAFEISKKNESSIKMTKEKGFVILYKNQIPEINELVSLSRKLFENWHEKDLPKIPGTTFTKILDQDDIEKHPLLVNVALSDVFINTITEYLGAVPVLQDINIWYSTEDSDLHSSHLFHLDKPDVNYIGVFINIYNVDVDNGPLTLVPAETSRDIMTYSKYINRYYSEDNARINDDEMENYCSSEKWQPLVGKTGDAAIVDTSSCFHFGSRCKNSKRVVLQYRFAPQHKIFAKISNTYNFKVEPGDMHQLILDA